MVFEVEIWSNANSSTATNYTFFEQPQCDTTVVDNTVFWVVLTADLSYLVALLVVLVLRYCIGCCVWCCSKEHGRIPDLSDDDYEPLCGYCSRCFRGCMQCMCPNRCRKVEFGSQFVGEVITKLRTDITLLSLLLVDRAKVFGLRRRSGLFVLGVTFSLLVTLQVTYFMNPTKTAQAACESYSACRIACSKAGSSCYQCTDNPFNSSLPTDLRCQHATLSGYRSVYDSGQDVYIWPNRGHVSLVSAPCDTCACGNIVDPDTREVSTDVACLGCRGISDSYAEGSPSRCSNTCEASDTLRTYMLSSGISFLLGSLLRRPGMASIQYFAQQAPEGRGKCTIIMYLMMASLLGANLYIIMLMLKVVEFPIPWIAGPLVTDWAVQLVMINVELCTKRCCCAKSDQVTPAAIEAPRESTHNKRQSRNSVASNSSDPASRRTSNVRISVSVAV